MTDRVFLDPGLLSEVASFLKKPFALDAVCKSIRAVMHEAGRYRVKFAERRLTIARRRVKRPYHQICVIYIGPWSDCPATVTELARYSQIEVRIVWLASLEQLKSLRHNITLMDLYASPRNLSNMCSFAEFGRIETLDIVNSDFDDLNPIANLIWIKNLSVMQCPVTDLSPVRNFTRLEKLNITATKIRSIEPLRAFSGLRVFLFSRTQVTKLEVLPHLKYLEHVAITVTPSLDVSVFPKIGSLKKLEVFFPRTEETEIEVDWNQPLEITRIAFLEQMSTVESLLLCQGSFKLHSLESLRSATRLRFLDIAFTEVADLTPLGEMHELEILTAYSTRRLTDVSILARLRSLRELHVNGSKVTAVACLEASSGLQILFISKKVTGFEILICKGVKVYRV
jgi:internalin A